LKLLFDSEMKKFKVLTSKQCVRTIYLNLETQDNIYCKSV